MKAVVCTKYGSPDVLQLKEVEKPIPKENEVLVKIHATTVNRTDLATLTAKPFFARIFTGLFKPKKSILGTEFAGEIETVGKNVSSYNVGDKVFGFNDNDFGAHAQFMTIGEDKGISIIPKDITFQEAAASTEGAFYAYNFINKINLKREQKVLVNGATGAIGSAAVQLLKYFDADITAVCNTKDIDLIKTLGANKVFDYTKEDFTKDNQTYDYIFDTVGKSSFAKCKPVLNASGIYISSELGDYAQNIFYALITPLFGKKKVIFPMPNDLLGCILLTKKLIELGKFKTVIDRKYPLEQIFEAYKYVATGQKTGNVVITVE